MMKNNEEWVMKMTRIWWWLLKNDNKPMWMNIEANVNVNM